MEAKVSGRGRHQDHPLRLAILRQMKEAGEPVSGAAIADALGENRSTVGYHLAVLRDDGRVVFERAVNHGSYVEYLHRLTGSGS